MGKYRIDNLDKIDKLLNEKEMYFRSRWYNTGSFKPIRKAKPKERCHLVIMNYKPMQFLGKFKYSTIATRLIDTKDYKDIYTFGIKTTMDDKQIEYSWGEVDYIIFETYLKKKNSSVFYYVNSKKFINVLKKLGEEVFHDKIRNKYFFRYMLKTGFTFEDLNESFGVVDYIDHVYWNKKYIYVAKSESKLPSYLNGNNTISFLSERDKLNEDYKKLYWHNFKLKVRSDQSKPVRVKVLKNQKTMDFPSIKIACRVLSEHTKKKLSEGSFNNVLAGRAKTIITPLGRITIEYINK